MGKTKLPLMSTELGRGRGPTVCRVVEAAPVCVLCYMNGFGTGDWKSAVRGGGLRGT